jgi:hypothetical protein
MFKAKFWKNNQRVFDDEYWLELNQENMQLPKILKIRQVEVFRRY